MGQGKISFWYDGWFYGGPLTQICDTSGDLYCSVSSFLDEKGWSRRKLENVLPVDIVEEVVNVLVQKNEVDKQILKLSSDGKLSTKLAWNIVRQNNSPDGVWVAIWSRLLSPRISIFSWRFLKQKLPVDIVLKQKGVLIASKCQCCSEEETWEHLFFYGPLALGVWRHFG